MQDIAVRFDVGDLQVCTASVGSRPPCKTQTRLAAIAYTSGMCYLHSGQRLRQYSDWASIDYHRRQEMAATAITTDSIVRLAAGAGSQKTARDAMQQ